jgi:hypothetical protein
MVVVVVVVVVEVVVEVVVVVVVVVVTVSPEKARTGRTENGGPCCCFKPLSPYPSKPWNQTFDASSSDELQ